MAIYRVYEYPNAKVPYKHIYIKRDRTDYLNREQSIRDKILEEIEKGEKFSQSISRAKRNITDIALCNDFEYFCTFTFNGKVVDRYSMQDCSKRLRKFFNNFKARYAPDFKYLIVPEYHKDGAVHFHGLCGGFPAGEMQIPETILKRNKFTGELDSVPNTKGYYYWARYDKALGVFNCSQIKSRNASAFYLQKYVTKDLQKLGKGLSIYMCSKSLKRPELIFDDDDTPFLLDHYYENDYVKVGYDIYEDTDELFDKHNLYTPFGYAKSFQCMKDEIDVINGMEDVYYCEQMELIEYGK